MLDFRIIYRRHTLRIRPWQSYRELVDMKSVVKEDVDGSQFREILPDDTLCETGLDGD